MLHPPVLPRRGPETGAPDVLAVPQHLHADSPSEVVQHGMTILDSTAIRSIDYGTLRSVTASHPIGIREASLLALVQTVLSADPGRVGGAVEDLRKASLCRRISDRHPVNRAAAPLQKHALAERKLLDRVIRRLAPQDHSAAGGLAAAKLAHADDALDALRQRISGEESDFARSFGSTGARCAHPSRRSRSESVLGALLQARLLRAARAMCGDSLAAPEFHRVCVSLIPMVAWDAAFEESRSRSRRSASIHCAGLWEAPRLLAGMDPSQEGQVIVTANPLLLRAHEKARILSIALDLKVPALQVVSAQSHWIGCRPAR